MKKSPLVTRKIGMNRGKPRIWLEGAVLTNANIHHGMRFDIVNSPNSLVIVCKVDGKRKIAGKPNRPIIDMSAGTITASEFISKIVKVEKGKHPRTLVITGLPV